MFSRTPRGLAAGVLASLSLTACSAGHTATVADTDSPAVVLATTSAATSLDFTSTGGAAITSALMGNVFETLVQVDSGEIVPGLAHRWDVSPDARTYTFHLREGITFSDGAAFNADTAAFSIDYVRNHWTNGISSQMDAVESATAIAPHTLQVRLAQPSQRWLWSMATAVGAMMHPGGIGNLAHQPIGTGPFRVARFSPSEFVELAARPDYWGTPAASDVTIRYFPDTLSSVNALQSGSVDVVWAVQNPELLGNLPDDIGVEVGSTHGEILVSMNNRAAPFNDPRVRRAVALGVDREGLNQVLFDGLATDTGGAPIAPSDPWFSEKDYAPYDPQAARALMEEAGAVGTPLRLTVPTLPYTQTLAEALFSQLRDLGFAVELESAEFPALWLGQVMGAKDYQMSMIAHVEPRDITTIFGNPDYYVGYDDPETRELFAAADRAPTREENAQLMQQAVERIMDNAGSLTIANMPNIVLTAPGVEGVHPDMVSDGLILRDLKEAQ
ncbi:ABC transporter substrate-binding protein [Corynebacterium lizhenjunii]|uniref:ABC transporter substrate-binding protein n=1 Tax=Corynebacterium lizhenjunii TaxID=2709394 RepID=UPI0013ED4F28|nr:ABC transporter substrate-binding protein [Corynebacterium lizhenjunii]